MGYVMIGYAPKDRRAAEAVRDSLLRLGVDTWMAAHDVPQGQRYEDLLEGAVADCACMVTVRSEASVGSARVRKEVTLAVAFGKAIFSVKPDGLQGKTLDCVLYLACKASRLADEKEAATKTFRDAIPELEQFCETQSEALGEMLKTVFGGFAEGFEKAVRNAEKATEPAAAEATEEGETLTEDEDLTEGETLTEEEILTVKETDFSYPDRGAFSEALPLTERLRGADTDPEETQKVLQSLASLYRKAERYGDAVNALEQARDLCVEAYGGEDARTLRTMNSLAEAYSAHGEEENAMAIHEHVFRLRCRVLGGDAPETLASLHSLASAKAKKGLYKSALPLYEALYTTLCLQVGERDEDALTVLGELANCHKRLDHGDKAMELSELYYRLHCSIHGETEFETLQALSTLAGLYADLGAYAKAAERYEELLHRTAACYGEDDEFTQRTKRNLESVRSML